MDEKYLKELFDKLGLEAKGVKFEDFTKALSEDADYKKNVFNRLVKDGIYKEGEEDIFSSKITGTEVKKK